MNNDADLIVGSSRGKLSKYNLSIPSAPALMNNIQLSLSYEVFCTVKMNDNSLLCGQGGGYLSIVDHVDFKTTA